MSTLDEFWKLHAEELSRAVQRTGVGAGDALVVFTAHSLPVLDLETPERYVSGLRTVAEKIAEDVGFAPGSEFSASGRLPGLASFGAPDSSVPWMLAYQSKGQRAGEWLGPDISEVMEVAARQGFRAVVVSPIGFATEHMETRYDLDVVEADRAGRLGIGFERGAAPNDEPRLVGATAAAVRSLLQQGT